MYEHKDTDSMHKTYASANETKFQVIDKEMNIKIPSLTKFFFSPGVDTWWKQENLLLKPLKALF